MLKQHGLPPNPLKQHGQLHRGQAPTFSNEVATLESNNNSLSIIKKG